MKLRQKILWLMGSSLFCGVVGLTGLLLHQGSPFQAESARITAPEARIYTVNAYEEWAWVYLLLVGISLGSSVWLLVLVDRQVLSRLQGGRDKQGRARASVSPQHLNTFLEEQVQRQTARLQQALNYEATLKRITDKVRDSLEEEQILQTAVQELATRLEVLGCDSGLYDLELGVSRITCESGAGLPPNLKRTVPIEAQSGLYSRLLAGDPVLLCQIPPIH
ncbi:MAG: hypothetical protein Q6M04_07245, partial [Thermostichus sp. BF3_bins_97]